MTRDELVRELERLYAATENPALFAGSLISYAAHVVKSDVFDAAYRHTTGMTFGLAIEALKTGQRVARAGWNGKGMWVEYVPAKDFSFSELNPHFVIKNTNNSFSTWVPSITDCLADDWQIV